MSINKLFKNPFVFLLILIVCVGSGTLFYLKKRKHQLLDIPPVIATDKMQTSFNTNFFFDLETLDGLSGTDNIKPCDATHSGKMACNLSGGVEFGPSVIKRVQDVSALPLKRIGASVWVFPLSENSGVVLTATVTNSKNESVFWDGKSTEKLNLPKNQWTKVNALYNLPVDKIKPEDIVQINVWNKGKTDVLIDDIEVVYGETPERRGVASTVDANSIYEKRFVSQKNKAPFPVLYLTKQEIGNNNETFITLDKTRQSNNTLPTDDYLAGDFIADKNGLDELLCIKENELIFFEYNTEHKQFSNVLELSINAENKGLWSNATNKYAGDFNGDGKKEIVLFDKKNNRLTMVELKNKSFNTITDGTISGLSSSWTNTLNHAFVSRTFSTSKADALTMLTNNACFTLEFNKQKNCFEEKTNHLSASDTGIFEPTNFIYEGKFDGDKNTFLKLDTDWRFDFKQLHKTTEGFTISHTIDFKGYANDYNPKYYELVKIISGNFIEKNKASLLVFMGNCADEHFDGCNCKTLESLPYLPNGTQLYLIER